MRHFGFLVNRCRARRLVRIRTALAAPAPTPEKAPENAAPFDGYPCPKCRIGRRRIVAQLAPQRGEGERRG